jgi:hypothetical protein
MRLHDTDRQSAVDRKKRSCPRQSAPRPRERIRERACPLINEELKSDGFKPTPLITMTLKGKPVATLDEEWRATLPQ